MRVRRSVDCLCHMRVRRSVDSHMRVRRSACVHYTIHTCSRTRSAERVVLVSTTLYTPVCLLSNISYWKGETSHIGKERHLILERRDISYWRGDPQLSHMSNPPICLTLNSNPKRGCAEFGISLANTKTITT
jgi:hypothetical protein